MLILSLAVNILVLAPVCISLLRSAGWTTLAYGAAAPARGILLSVYLAILLGSVALLGLLCAAPSPAITAMAIALLAIQVLYKVSTPFTVGTLSNPVVVSNLLIATLHLIAISLSLGTVLS
jgi:hypothetical protein